MAVTELLWLPLLPHNTTNKADTDIFLLSQLSDRVNAVTTHIHSLMLDSEEEIPLYVLKPNKIKVVFFNKKAYYLLLLISKHWVLQGSYLMDS